MLYLKKGQTALYHAVGHGHLTIAKMLVEEFQCDPHIKTKVWIHMSMETNSAVGIVLHSQTTHSTKNGGVCGIVT